MSLYVIEKDKTECKIPEYSLRQAKLVIVNCKSPTIVNIVIIIKFEISYIVTASYNKHHFW